MRSSSVHVLLVAVLVVACPLDVAPSGHTGNAAGRAVAVTFGDLSVVPRHDLDTDRAITARLLKAIISNNVQAIGFVNENKLYEGAQINGGRVALLRMWLDAGLELGNHTFSHPDLHTTPLDTFVEDVVRGEMVTRSLLAARGRQLRYFRHPFPVLTSRRRRASRCSLSSRGYRVAPVTIDNSEWIFERAYDNAAGRGDTALMRRIARTFVGYMGREFDYYERQSRMLFGYEVKQVLLLHANALNAGHFDSLARMISKRGYRFISLDEALKDRAYNSADTFTGRGGITWLHRWALRNGQKGKILANEPATPGFVMKEAGVTAE